MEGSIPVSEPNAQDIGLEVRLRIKDVAVRLHFHVSLGLTGLGRLVAEIRDGTLGGLPHGDPDPERADELEQYAKTFGAVHPYILASNSALASLYLPRVREMYGPGAPVTEPRPPPASDPYLFLV